MKICPFGSKTQKAKDDNIADNPQDIVNGMAFGRFFNSVFSTSCTTDIDNVPTLIDVINVAGKLKIGTRLFYL